jgi:hypothetical protein
LCIKLRKYEKANYKIVVQNCISSEPNNRCFSFIYDKDFKLLYNELNKYCMGKLSDILSHDIQIDNHKNLLKRASHRIIINKIDTKESYCISVRFPDYSSDEIIEKIIEEFC